MIMILEILKFLMLVCCLLLVPSKANDAHFTTISSVQEDQVISSKDVKKLNRDVWSWSQPDNIASSTLSEQHSFSPNFDSGYYLPEDNFNHHGVVAQRAEYYPYPYEIGPADDAHHVTTVQSSENAIGSITKHFAIVSFIGLLLLFAIVQNSMSASSKQRDTLLARRRRDVIELHGLDPMTPEQEEVLSEDTKVRCMQLTLCLENKKLRKQLGKTGKLLAKYLTKTVKNSVGNSSGWDRLLEDASQAGLRGEDCSILYRDCSPSESSDKKLE